MTRSQEDYKRFKRVTLVGSVYDILLGITKIITGVIYHSHALVIDGLHSFSDLLTDIFVLIVGKYGHTGPDEDHPYGHGKIETLGTSGLGLFLTGSAGALAWDGISRPLFNHEIMHPTKEALFIAALSYIVKEIVFRYTYNAGKELKNDLIIANAWHSRSDAWSSLVVFVGILSSILGFTWGDAISAFIVAIFIAKMGIDLVWKGIKELADTALTPQMLAEIKKIILSVDGVISFHNLRGRTMGQRALLDVNIQVDPKLSVSEGHEIASWVAKEIIDSIEEVDDVTVHTDVENDLVKEYSSEHTTLLPLRKQLLDQLHEQWKGIKQTHLIKKIGLHYLKKNIHLEIYLDVSILNELSIEEVCNMEDKFKEDALNNKWVNSVIFWYG